MQPRSGACKLELRAWTRRVGRNAGSFGRFLSRAEAYLPHFAREFAHPAVLPFFTERSSPIRARSPL